MLLLLYEFPFLLFRRIVCWLHEAVSSAPALSYPRNHPTHKLTQPMQTTQLIIFINTDISYFAYSSRTAMDLGKHFLSFFFLERVTCFVHPRTRIGCMKPS